MLAEILRNERERWDRRRQSKDGIRNAETIRFKTIYKICNRKIWKKYLQKQLPKEFYKKKVILDILQSSHENVYVGVFFDKIADVRPVTLLKSRLQYKCFSVNFAKISKFMCFLEHLRTSVFVSNKTTPKTSEATVPKNRYNWITALLFYFSNISDWNFWNRISDSTSSLSSFCISTTHRFFSVRFFYFFYRFYRPLQFVIKSLTFWRFIQLFFGSLCST